jgi:methylthioribose-1-phosphate isomerase
MVDLCIVGTDRTTARGDVCNKIGTYLKAIAARENNVPFYVAAPSSSIDFSIMDGLAEVPIEERDSKEFHEVHGRLPGGGVGSVHITPEGSEASNPAFDVTPARYISALITDRGVCPATVDGLSRLFGDPARTEPSLPVLLVR